MKRLIKRFVPRYVRTRLRELRAMLSLISSAAVAQAVGEVDAGWRMRIDDAMSSPDNAKIPRCAKAGTIDGYVMTMHNGVRVCANGYYGSGNLNLLIENRGVHEPQEEYVFEEIVRLLPERPTMMELGAYWGFYSLSLLQSRPRAKCYLVEPEMANLASCKVNFWLNRRSGRFLMAAVGREPQDDPKVVTVDSLCATWGIKHLDILHADIQGYELQMIEGATTMLSQARVKYVFLSTHSDELHVGCREALRRHGYIIVTDANLQETFSYDGLIVAKHHSVVGPHRIEISRKHKSRDGFLNQAPNYAGE